MSYIVDLNKNTRWRADLVGTKAFNLQKLMLLDVNVPKCSIVTTDAYKEFSTKGISGTLLKELTRKYSKWKGTLIARSSCVAEDTAQSSKAGVFTTIADVKSLSDLIKGIERVWYSSGGEDIAVILQEQLDPDISGVIFTCDPVTGAKEKVIEYVKGMGEALVSGKKNPKRVTGADRRFKELVDVVVKLESFFSCPLDIEWGKVGNKFHILQVRPITALPPPTTGTTYSMILAEQFFSGPVTPMFYSQFKFLFEKYYAGETAIAIGLDVMPEEDLIIRHKDYLYVNTKPTESLLKITSGNFQQQLMVLPEDLRTKYSGNKRRNVVGVLGLLLKIGFLLLKNPKLKRSRVDIEFTRKTVPAILSGLETLGEPIPNRKELDRQYQKLMDLLILHIRVSKWGLVYCIMLTSLIQRFLEKNRIPNPEEKLLTLISGLLHNRTMEGIDELRILASKYKLDKKIRKILRKELDTYNRYRKELEKINNGRKFVESFESILSRYGHRRLSRDLIEPSWLDDPMIPFTILINLVLEPIPHSAKIRGIKKRQKAFLEILDSIPIYKRPRFKIQSSYLVRYVAFREFQRFYLDMILSKMRSVLLTVGNIMVTDGIIDERDDIFFLEIGEIESYLRGSNNDLTSIAALRRLTFRESDDKPGLYLRNGVDFNSIFSSDDEEVDGRVIKGQPVSVGSFRGKIKVIANIDSSSVISPGEVLVTRSIDPGQSQAFSLAGGLVLEVGGILSHGAILAREFGIPTVAQVNNATERFHDGQDVVVNGTKGEVVLVK